jgi:transglutaminase-like putative cysteine protease
MYGPPLKPPKDQERMVAAGKVDVIENHGKLPDNRRPSRDFDTGRKGPKTDKKPDSQAARGLFEVDGRTPLHIRLVVYERYDADEKRWIEARKPGSKLIEPDGGDWMRLGQFKASADWYREDERHKLKAADMTDNTIPTPALLTRFRINKVDKPDYYEWDYDGVLALAGRKRTPPGVTVSTNCRTLDPVRIPDSAFSRAGQTGGTAPEFGEVPAAFRGDIDRLAREWAGDLPRGWPQIEAVVTKLRSEYTFDPTAAAPPDHPVPVVWFLTESRRGPDYLFATATALLLRSLDYPARVCLGYYASPDAYDPETAHTPVRKTDLHFWTEVRLHDGHWMVIEPTPGYEVLGPKLPLIERIGQALVAIAAWVWRHVVELVVVLAVLVVIWVRRRELFDAVAVRLWRWWPGRTWRERVQRAVRVLERRGRWAGRARAARQTTFSWLRGVQPQGVDGDSDFGRLTRMAEWAAYGPDVPPPWSDADVLVVCRSVLDRWPLRRWREADLPDSAMGA